MGFSYRRIDGDPAFAEVIWAYECGLPEWFRLSSRVWTDGLDAFMEFYANCDEIYGLFDDGADSSDDGGRLLACILLEISGIRANIHVSVTDKRLAHDRLIRFFRAVKQQKAAEGIRIMEAWILAANRPLRRVAGEVGFVPSGLRMTFGRHRDGRGMDWLQYRG